MFDNKNEQKKGTALGAPYNPFSTNHMENIDHSHNPEILPGFDKVDSFNFFDEIY